MRLSRLTAVAIATLAAACALAAGAEAAPNGARACANAGYSYAGVQSVAPARGISARIAAVRSARVTSGHVAAWIGLGGAGQGANGSDEWVQVGVASLPGGTTELYYEVAFPGARAAYTSLGAVTAGERHQVSVLETEMPGIWLVWLDGRAVSQPLNLPGSHGAWSPMATSESYDGGYTSCNGYGFEFSELETASLTGWQPMRKVHSFVDRGHSLRTLASDSILVNRR
jgi:hypothetical protein